MKFVPYDLRKLDNMGMRKSDLFEYLEAFLKGGTECAKVVDYPQSSPTSCANALRSAIKKYRFGIQVCVRGNDVFVIRKQI